MLVFPRRSALGLMATLALTACGTGQKTAQSSKAASGNQASETSPSASPAGEQSVETGVRTDSGYHLNTVLEGAPTVTLYTDLQCPYCARTDPTYREVARRLAGTMNLTVRHFPLPMHANALPAAQAVQAAEKQGAYMAMSGKIFEHQTDWKGLTDIAQLTEIFTGYARELKLNTDRFIADLPDAAGLKLIQDEFEAGNEVGVHGTPSFVIDGVLVEKVDSSTSADHMVAAFTEQAGL
ncbi:DsbA family protein [Rothia sp. P5764]|uniref:DsbA family protein n=1 Tax=Rothia sp. P5764 TaxID=3402654 RepID=UPI003AD73E6A